MGTAARERARQDADGVTTRTSWCDGALATTAIRLFEPTLVEAPSRAAAGESET